ncbi:MAG: hypothetical protein OQK24_09605 [Magnetovibrio sp.]|nr:hypothetical protein [Magnetovibrio sp.]
MTNRMTLVGALFATLAVAYPTVAAADNPWRADPQAKGAYAPSNLTQSLQTQTPPAPLPKYAPLDGRIEDENKRNQFMQPYGLVPGGVPVAPYGYAPGIAATPYLGGLGNPGLGYPGYGYPGIGYPSLSVPYGGGLWPGLGGGNGLGGPWSWMPF